MYILLFNFVRLFYIACLGLCKLYEDF